jgi:dihydroorotate dehydrogenase (NAD+) catalytic subunit
VFEWGGIITKSVTRYPREGNSPPRIAETSSGMLNSIGLANLGVDQYCKEIIPFLNELETRVIINIAGSTMEDYLDTMEILESTNGKHVAYEINISCPNVKKGGMEFGVSADMTEQLTAEMRNQTDKLLIMKLGPNVTSIEEIAKAAEFGGADAVSAINTVVGMAIDSTNCIRSSKFCCLSYLFNTGNIGSQFHDEEFVRLIPHLCCELFSHISANTKFHTTFFYIRA